MLKHILKTHTGDLLEFDIHLIETPAVGPQIGEDRPLYEGETVFFKTDKDKDGNDLDLTQADLHFVISEVELSPGQYPFRAGIIFATGERQIVFDPKESVIVVGRP